MKPNFENRLSPIALPHPPGIRAPESVALPGFPNTTPWGMRAHEADGRTTLLISTDLSFHEALRHAANQAGRMVVRVESLAGAVPILHAVRPAAVMLDLDMPEEAAWKLSEALLHDPACPPVILLTGRSEQFDMRTAIRAGSILAKSESPERTLEQVQEIVSTQASNLAERNAIQRTLIRWLKPSSWSAAVTPAHRFWGINE